MTIKELIDSNLFELVSKGDREDVRISVPYCCDLFSHVIGHAPERCAWVTVIGNRNTLGVASLVKATCVILAEGTEMDYDLKERAGKQGITVLKTDKTSFEAALLILRYSRE